MEGVEVFITFASNQNSSTRGNPCYVFVEDVKTKRNVMQEHLWDSSTDSASRVINVLSSCGENYYDVGESLTADQFIREEKQYAKEESYKQNINVNMGGDIGSTHILENAMKVPNDEEY